MKTIILQLEDMNLLPKKSTMSDLEELLVKIGKIIEDKNGKL